MAYFIIRHKVADFSKWKPLYDAHSVVRRQSGCKNEQLFRLSSDSNDLIILFEWDSIENARKFSQSDELRSKMREAGVIGEPEFQFLEQVEKKITGEELGKAA